jgi:hypothetical protein
MVQVKVACENANMDALTIVSLPRNKSLDRPKIVLDIVFHQVYQSVSRCHMGHFVGILG